MEQVRVFWDRWWRTAVSFAAVAVVAAMTFVLYTVVDERRYFEQEAARDRRQDRQMTALIEAQQAASAEREAQMAETVASALGQAEALLADLFAQHDQNVALKLNETLRRIESLLGRPAGEPLDPVTAQPYVTATPHATPAPAPAPSAPAPTVAPRPPAPTPTTPDQKGCVKRPDGPRC